MPTDYLKPKSTNIREPLSNEKMNGRVMNPPRFAELGGLKSAKRRGAMTKNSLSIRRPGDAK